MDQKAFSFDRVTIEKILKGAWYAGIAGAITYTVAVLDVIDVDVYAPAQFALISFLANAIREFLKGQSAKKSFLAPPLK